jgi:hypothetical protein
MVDAVGVNRDVAPVIAAEALLDHGMDGELIVAYLRKTWNLDDIDAAALAAARVLQRRERLRRAKSGPSDES